MRPLIDFDYGKKHFTFEIRSQIVKIVGDSGTGKTMFYDYVEMALRGSKLGLMEYPIKDLDTNKYIDTILIDGLEESEAIYKLNNIKDKKDSLIIIDEADSLMHKNKNIVNIIENDYNNYYVLISRTYIPGLTVNTKYFSCVRLFGNEIKVQYKINGKWV